MDYQLLWKPVENAIPELVASSLVTLQISVLSMASGTAIGLALAYAKLARGRLPRSLASTWIEIARNTPVLFQIYVCYFGLGAFGVFLGSWMSVFVALSFNTAGYMAETFRGGFNGINPAQYSLAKAIGLTWLQAQVRIVIPQLMRIVFLPMTNQFIWVILMSSLGMLVGLRELTGETQFQYSKTFRAFEFFLATAVIYYLLAKFAQLLAHVFGWLLLPPARSL